MLNKFKQKFKKFWSEFKELFNDDSLWMSFMFFIIILIIIIFSKSGLYEMNESIVSAFAIGTLVLTIADILENKYIKKIFLCLGMLCIFVLSHSPYLLYLISKICNNNDLTLLSLLLVFLSMTINQSKGKRNEEYVNRFKLDLKASLEAVDKVLESTNDISKFNNKIFENIKVCLADDIPNGNLKEHLENDEIRNLIDRHSSKNTNYIEQLDKIKNSLNENKQKLNELLEKVKKD